MTYLSYLFFGIVYAHRFERQSERFSSCYRGQQQTVPQPQILHSAKTNERLVHIVHLPRVKYSESDMPLTCESGGRAVTIPITLHANPLTTVK